MIRIILSLCFLLNIIAAITAAPAAADKESVYERIIRTGEIRCGYYLFKPATWIEPNSGELKGFSVDIWELLGENMGLTVKWVEEVDFSTMYEGLNTGRYDAICSPSWPNSRNARVAAFSAPLFFASINAYVRANDTRFDPNEKTSWQTALNRPEIKLAVQDGSVEAHIANTRFPKAAQISVPQSAPATQIEINVQTGKADATFLDANRAQQYLKHNPGSLRRLGDHPIQVFPFKIPVLASVLRFKNHLDIAIEELLNNGEIERILDQYDPDHILFARTAKPYEERK